MKIQDTFLLACGFCLLVFPSLFFAQSPACGFQWALDKQAVLDTSVLQRFLEVGRALEDVAEGNVGQISSRGETVVPVVVHVVWNTPEENVGDLTVLSQIEALNRDFNGENADLTDVPSEFRPSIAKEGIRFCLAAEDSYGASTSGILRTRTSVEAIGAKDDLFFSAFGGSDAWDTERYLNIWVANTGEFITGFGTFPGQVEAERQGVVVHPAYFGKNSSQRYGLGRVAVHEVGHYLGLKHTWDGNAGCNMTVWRTRRCNSILMKAVLPTHSRRAGARICS